MKYIVPETLAGAEGVLKKWKGKAKLIAGWRMSFRRREERPVPIHSDRGYAENVEVRLSIQQDP